MTVKVTMFNVVRTCIHPRSVPQANLFSRAYSDDVYIRRNLSQVVVQVVITPRATVILA